MTGKIFLLLHYIPDNSLSSESFVSSFIYSYSKKEIITRDRLCRKRWTYDLRHREGRLESGECKR